MAITELATLQFKPEYDRQTTGIAPLARIAELQSSCSGYPLRFFEDAQDTSIIYLITGWKDVGAHNDWISDQSQGLLRIFGEVLNVRGMVHLSIKPESIPADAKSFLFEVNMKQAFSAGGAGKEGWRLISGVNVAAESQEFSFVAFSSPDGAESAMIALEENIGEAAKGGAVRRAMRPCTLTELGGGGEV